MTDKQLRDETQDVRNKVFAVTVQELLRINTTISNRIKDFEEHTPSPDTDEIAMLRDLYASLYVSFDESGIS